MLYACVKSKCLHSSSPIPSVVPSTHSHPHPSHPQYNNLLPDRSWDFPDTLARLARWPKFSVAEVEAPFNEINKN